MADEPVPPWRTQEAAEPVPPWRLLAEVDVVAAESHDVFNSVVNEALRQQHISFDPVNDAHAAEQVLQQLDVAIAIDPVSSARGVDTDSLAAPANWIPPQFEYSEQANGYTMDAVVSMRAEGDVARMTRMRWQDRGPAFNDTYRGGPLPPTWRGQPLRANTGKYAKRGGEKVKDREAKKKGHVVRGAALGGDVPDHGGADGSGGGDGGHEISVR